MSLLLLTLTAAIVTADPAAAAAQRRADDAFIRGDYDTAIFHFNESIRLDPFELRPYAGRGAAYYRKKNYEKAIESYGEGLQIDPRSDALHFDRGTSYWSLGRAQAAADDFREAIRLNPKNDFAYNGLAWILATAPDDEMRDGRQSLKLATKACDLTAWKNPYHLSALAAAHAETGNFEEAVRRHRQSMALPDYPQDKLDRARQRLLLYEQRKPYRETFEKSK
jgi:tetratricopeptide (TPR) repeat protein